MHAQFVRTIQRDHHRQREHASRFVGQAGPAPDLSPRIARNKILKWVREFIPIFQRGIDMRVSQDRSARLHSLLISLAFIHQNPPWTSRNTFTSARKRSDALLYQRCESPSRAYYPGPLGPQQYTKNAHPEAASRDNRFFRGPLCDVQRNWR